MATSRSKLDAIFGGDDDETATPGVPDPVQTARDNIRRNRGANPPEALKHIQKDLGLDGDEPEEDDGLDPVEEDEPEELPPPKPRRAVPPANAARPLTRTPAPTPISTPKRRPVESEPPPAAPAKTEARDTIPSLETQISGLTQYLRELGIDFEIRLRPTK